MLLTIKQKKNTALTVMFPLTDADGQPITGCAALDSERSQDGGAFVDCTNEAAEQGVTGWYALTITAAELNFGVISVRVQTSTAGIMPTAFMITTYTATEDVTLAELAQAQPSATPTLRDALMLLYMALRNETETDATLLEIKNDAGTVICKATLSDDAVDFVRAKLVSGA